MTSNAFNLHIHQGEENKENRRLRKSLWAGVGNIYIIFETKYYIEALLEFS